MDGESLSPDAEAMLCAPVTERPLEFLKDGTVVLGPNNKGSLVRFMNLYQGMVTAGKPIPDGFLSRWIAERISDKDDRQDVIMGLFGGRGMGKSRSSLKLCYDVSRQLSKITGKPPEFYFSGNNVISLADGPEIARRLTAIPDMSCVICDDAGVGVNARDFQTKSNKGILRIISTIRTKKLFLIFNSPSASHLDVAVRQMLLLTAYVHKSCHAAPGGGYNILKVMRLSLNPWGKEFTTNLVGEAGKVNYWIVGNAPDAMVEEYDRVRAESAASLSEDVSEILSAKPKMRLSEKEKRAQVIAENKDAAMKILTENPDTSVRQLAAKLDLSIVHAGFVKAKLTGEDKH